MLLTRSPLIHPASWASAFDLHVLSTPPAFVLSQDQTLRKKLHVQKQRNKPPKNEFNLTKTNINTDVHIICPKGIAIHPQTWMDGIINLAFDNQVHTIEFSRTRHPPYTPNRASERQLFQLTRTTWLKPNRPNLTISARCCTRSFARPPFR